MSVDIFILIIHVSDTLEMLAKLVMFQFTAVLEMRGLSSILCLCFREIRVQIFQDSLGLWFEYYYFCANEDTYKKNVCNFHSTFFLQTVRICLCFCVNKQQLICCVFLFASD